MFICNYCVNNNPIEEGVGKMRRERVGERG